MTAASSAGVPESGTPHRTYTGQRLHTETKPSFKTTELFVFIAAVAAVLVASAVVGEGDGTVDRFPADQAWLYVTLLSIGYMISRGLAKAGSREPTEGDRT